MIGNKEKSKRKNDEPMGRRQLIIFVCAFIALMTGVVVFYFMSVPRFVACCPRQAADGTLYYMVGTQLYELDPQTEETTAIDSLPLLDGQTSDAVSRDGKWKAYWSLNADGKRYDLNIMDAQTSEVKVIASPYLADSHISWSADSEWLTFTAYDGLSPDGTLMGKPQAVIVQRATGQVQPITADVTVSRSTFAPVGTKLAYIADGILWVTDITTSLKTQVALLNVMYESITWSPDGGWLAYRIAPPETQQSADMNENPTNLWIVRADGTEAHIILRGDKGFQIMGWGS